MLAFRHNNGLKSKMTTFILTQILCQWCQLVTAVVLLFHLFMFKWQQLNITSWVKKCYYKMLYLLISDYTCGSHCDITVSVDVLMLFCIRWSKTRPSDEFESNWVPLWEICFFSCCRLHCDHQLSTNCVCTLFVAEPVVHTGLSAAAKI